MSRDHHYRCPVCKRIQGVEFEPGARVITPDGEGEFVSPGCEGCGQIMDYLGTVIEGEKTG